jgi:hypothetical protein
MISCEKIYKPEGSILPGIVNGVRIVTKLAAVPEPRRTPGWQDRDRCARRRVVMRGASRSVESGTGRNRAVPAAMMVACLLAAPAPSSAVEREETPLERLVLYVPNRLLDVFDIVNVSVAVGPGFGLMARASRLLNLGYDNYSVIRVGMNKRRFPAWDETVDEWGIGPYYDGGTNPRAPGEVGVTLHPFIAGAELGLDPLSMVDFLGGFFFIDLESDDAWFSRGERAEREE